MLVRLHKYMAECGAGARRKCEALIAGGRVTVDGVTVTEMGVKIDPLVNEVSLDGNPLTVCGKIYVALNKPVGYITSADDQFGRPTVLDFVDTGARLFPVGRLDYDSSGLLFLTNDGDFAYMLTHPKHKIEKKYLVTVEGKPSEAALNALRAGIVLSDGPCRPCKAELSDEGGSSLLITISEGRNRQIRRMLEAVGHKVLTLLRLQIGNVGLGDLLPGEYRFLSSDEISVLKGRVP